jgi:hypothetical protein
MDLTPYIESVRHGVTNAAALADDSTQQVAHRLGTAIESSTRLALIQALSDAAGTISAELAPASVEVRMSGQDPDFVVSVPPSDSEPTMLLPPTEEDAPDDGPDFEEEPLARISLRLPSSVKARVDEVAAADGISTNAWLIRAVVDALADRRRGGSPQPPHPPQPPFGGGVFGPHGPFGANGLFGSGGPFAPGRTERHRSHDRDRGRGDSSGGVQGWVR